MPKALGILAAIRRRVAASRRDESGFTLIELIAALSIFTLVMVSFAYGLQASLGVTRDNRLRTQASQLAARELEIVRNEFTSSDEAPGELGVTSVVTNPHPLPGGTEGQPLQLDGSSFTVKRSVQWLPAGVGKSACDGSNPEVTYPSMAVNVQVRWKEGQRDLSVENNTVLTPPKGTVSGDLGFIAAKVVGADGTGVAGVPVSIDGPGGPQTRETVVDTETGGVANGGCAVFAITTLGSYTVTLNTPGYISYDGHQSTSKTVVVTAGTIKVTPFSYDQAATVQLNRMTVETHDLPTPAAPATLFNPSMPPTGSKVLSAGTTTVGNLWPYPDGYTAWAGDCEQNDPAAGGAGRRAPVVVEPGDTETIDVPFTPVTVTVVDEEGNPQSGKTVLAMIIDGGSVACGPYTLGSSDTAGEIRSSLPAGTWAIRLDTEPMCYSRPPTDPCQATPQLSGDLTEVPMTLIVGGG